ncbi:MAG: ornithine carbamoyltransferase [Phycisphaeraceae bacterium]|nr:MAG: ornithine carbamoyltransferase [Phycisphaeraceae bacterium]
MPTTSPARSSHSSAVKSLLGRDLITVADLSVDEILSIFDLAARTKADLRAWRRALDGRAVVMLFEKDSLRTKVAFEVGVSRMGGHAIYHNHMDCRIGERESVSDYARNLERFADCIIARTFGHDVICELAQTSRVPVINALTEKYHPCQALTDLFTLREQLGTLDGASIAFVGDGNNVCHSLMLCSVMLGVDITVIAPKGYAPDEDVVEKARGFAAASGAKITLTSDLGAVEGVSAVYTDAWVSMGFEAEAAKRHVAFASYQVTPELMQRAGKQALFMHCLPAHRGFEVAPEVIDSEYSIVFEQAENRMHVQNSILLHLLGNGS